MFYEAVGLMISAESDPKKREAYLVRFLCLYRTQRTPLRPHSHEGYRADWSPIGP